MTPEAYLQAERRGSREEYGKFEFHDGKLIEMGGATKEHNRISLNLSGLFWQGLMNKPFEAFHSDMRTFAPQANSYFYPDLVVCQGEAKFKDQEFDNLTNPSLIIEILSSSTASIDRGAKFAAYRSIDTLNEYLLIASQSMQVEHYQKQQQHEWKIVIYEKPEDTLTLLGGEMTLSLRDIYRNLPFIQK
jgi:Uma2 family endonuclease